ncbi:hypothetical protein AVEN_62586-1 [Araneus ventricosus]|uniref:Helitron helicase-like domain-containing protein n=1 Tax=Araneus ventricosus TaxID=182803 RepID=A0A4Y2UBW3_ARAVE|nr:hypothetical protein AVEN_256629-1 [Araneus ventricosus]GBO09081.1 hypothetical protein AVEN_62586-1 [Araneus ventricosus]
MSTEQYKLKIRADKTPVAEHERLFYAPTVNEVTIVMVEDESDRREMIIQKRGEGLESITKTHRSYDSLQYPIIFCQGEDGIRTVYSNHILLYRQLFHQYIVDMYAKIESEHLLYIKFNQQKLRVEYIHLKDAITNDENVSDIGRMVILLTTCIGSPRHMHKVAERGLPHAHILIRIKEKIRPGVVENVIRADIPDVQQDLVLFEIISKHMIHGPCGALNMKPQCMKDKK